ncbi:ROK family protein [Candidatus Izemoplasma sp. B36]|uniref:ROK family protein n=1 Tax=Candidatus Izemoplasma sp. B36 TaxID=3242468 RepID=UPI0035575041
MSQFTFNIKPKETVDLDPLYSPMILNNIVFENQVRKSLNPVEINIAIERSRGMIHREKCYIFNDTYHEQDANFIYVERLIKTLLWVKGGFRIYLAGDEVIGRQVQDAYSINGLREFDREFMSRVYEKPFEVIITTKENMPVENEVSKPIGRHLDGCRIGFDAGGSDRKVSAVINGEPVYSEEVVWHPKTNSNPDYHYEGILDSISRAASKLPQVDAIGISSAGIFIDNRVAVASLFRKVPKQLFDEKIKDIYIQIQKDFNGVPIEVINDGDVTALAGAMSLNSNNVLGIAMGTSEAVGYVDELGNITGWLNELSFAPVDYNKQSLLDEWSMDYGVGSTYFSQDAVIKLAKQAKIKLDDQIAPAEKLKAVQELVEADDERAKKIFSTIGIYLGYTLPYYARFYQIERVLILGRVTSKKGGDIILSKAKEILKTEFSELYHRMVITLPDEKSRRVGQSVAAASLPKLEKEGLYEIK